MNRMPVIEGLMNYINEGVTPFHMPGHKNNRRKFEELDYIAQNLYSMDNTEVPGLDNLHMPEDMILGGEKLAARAFKAHKSYFLVNGSTCGIYSMIMGVTKPNDRVIVQRNCHRSVFMACMMGELDAVYINPEVSSEFGIAVSIDVDRLIEVMDKNMDAKAIVLTYPTYYGTCSDLGRIVTEAHKRGMLVLVDEAHGAHLYFGKGLPKGAMELGADIAVTSLHKTTPALTQTALLNVRDGINTTGIEFMLRLHQSTSPSYIFMASIDASRYIMETRGEGLIHELLENINWFRNKITPVDEYKLLGIEHIGVNNIYNIDKTKIVIKSTAGGKKLDEILRQHGIQVEMSDIYNVVLICSVGDTRESFEKLYNVLMDCRAELSPMPGTGEIEGSMPQYKSAMNMREAYYKPQKRVKLNQAEGLASCELVAPYPPGIPVLLPGEIITKEVIESIESYKSRGIQINGLTDSDAQYINVVSV